MEKKLDDESEVHPQKAGSTVEAKEMQPKPNVSADKTNKKGKNDYPRRLQIQKRTSKIKIRKLKNLKGLAHSKKKSTRKHKTKDTLNEEKHNQETNEPIQAKKPAFDRQSRKRAKVTKYFPTKKVKPTPEGHRSLKTMWTITTIKDRTRDSYPKSVRSRQSIASGSETQENPPKRKKLNNEILKLNKENILENKLRGKFNKRIPTDTQQIVPPLDNYDRKIMAPRVANGDRLLFRRHQLAKYMVKPKSSPKFWRISNKIINDINIGYPVALICQKKKSNGLSTRKKCNGQVNLYKCTRGSNQDIFYNCSKCGMYLADSGEEDQREPSRLSSQGSFKQGELKICFLTLLADMGHEGYERILQGLGIDHNSRSTYYNHSNQIYLMMEDHYDLWQRRTIEEVKTFYAKNKIFPDSNGQLSITVSCDGSYPKRGVRARSLFVCSFIFESYTGYAIDCFVTRRCTTCETREVLNSECQQENKLFHGKSGDLEVENAKRLFERSKELNLKYTTIVCDGDSNSYKAVKDTYGMNSVEKAECIPHFQKRAWKHYNDACHNASVITPTNEGKKKIKENEEIKQKWEEEKEKNPEKYIPEPKYSVLTASDYKTNYPLRGGSEGLLEKRIATRLSKLCIVAMDQNRHGKTPAIAMSRALMAIPRHYSDWSGATLQEREECHKFCNSSFCKFKQLTEHEKKDWKPSDDGVFGAVKDKSGKHFIIPKETQDKIYKKIDENLAKESTMARCVPWLNQNINESAHAKLYYICAKVKHIETARLTFAMRHVAVVSNAGFYSGSLLSILGMTTEEEESYKRCDMRTIHRACNPVEKKKAKLIKVSDYPIQYEYGNGFEKLDKRFEVILPELVPAPLPSVSEAPYRYSVPEDDEFDGEGNQILENLIESDNENDAEIVYSEEIMGEFGFDGINDRIDRDDSKQEDSDDFVLDNEEIERQQSIFVEEQASGSGRN